MRAPTRLMRRPRDGMLAGVAAGVAATSDRDPTLVRLLFVLLAIVTGGVAALAYVAAALVIPREGERPGPESVQHGTADLIDRGKDLAREVRRVVDQQRRTRS
jgi:phage shock protein C